MDEPLAELAAYFRSKSRLPDQVLVRLTEAALAAGSRQPVGRYRRRLRRPEPR